MSTLHIHAPRGQYIGQIRRVGCQKWQTIVKPCKTAANAMIKAVKAMRADHKRARVLLIVVDGWYEPNLVMELSK